MRSKYLFAILLSFSLANFSCERSSPPQHKGTEVVIDHGPDASDKLVIYQLMTRLFSNTVTTNKTYGTLAENGVGKMNGITDKALTEIRELGVTHVWLTGILEHATMSAFPEIPADDADVVKGRAGSPYAIKDYYDIAPALAENPAEREQEFAQLLNRIHGAGLQALIDFVPNHVARAYHSDHFDAIGNNFGDADDITVPFAVHNNFYYLPGTSFEVPGDHQPLGAEKAPGEDGKFTESPAKVTGNNVYDPAPKGWDWFETVKLNYGVERTDTGEVTHFDSIPDTWTKMRDILLFWAGKGVDGFRCDMAEMVPVEFWQWCIAEVKKAHPEVIFIAEIYNPAAYHAYVQEGGFDYLYDKVGTYDRIRELMQGEGDTRRLTKALAQSKGIEEKMLRFLENHDEQRIASPDFAGDPWAAVPGMTVSALLNKGPTLLYFGQEVGEPGRGAEGFQGEDGRTTIFDYWGVPEHQKWMNGGKFDGGGLSKDQLELRDFYGELMRLSRYSEAVSAGDFYELPTTDSKVYAFLRYTKNERLLVVAHFGREGATDVALQVPAEAWTAMGLNPAGGYVFADLLLTEDMVEIEAENASKKAGIALNLPPLSAMVFQIESR